MKFTLAAVALSSLVSSAAMATTTDWGTHDAVEVASPLVSPGLFMDFFKFSTPGASALASSAVSTNVSISVPVSVDILKVVGGMYSLWSNPDGIIGSADDVSMAGWTWGFTGSTGNVSNQVNLLASGNYYYAVSGMAAGASGGSYTLVSTVTPVPEPETYAMMLAGLVAVGFLARRRG